MMIRRSLPLALAVAVMVPSGALHAQDEQEEERPITGIEALNDRHTPSDTVTAEVPMEPYIHPRAMDVPFGIGERWEYQVKLGIFSVGDGVVEVHGIDTVRGNPSYHVSMKLKGGFMGANVDDTFSSWFDVRNLASHRFYQDINEVNYHSKRSFEIYPRERRWVRQENDAEETFPSSRPLDDISFVYFVRTLPLEVGQEYSFDRYFKAGGNPVSVRVLRRDQREVPAGTFNTLVIEPVFQTSGLYGDGGEAEVHLSDDDDRVLVYMRTKIPVIRSMTLHLRNARQGLKVQRAATAETDAGGGDDADTWWSVPGGGR